MARYYGHAHPGVMDDEVAVAGIDPVSQVIRLVAGAVETLLALRLVLRAFGASAASGFVKFIYDLTFPLVQPFYGMFRTTIDYRYGTLELETIVAMLVYALVAYLVLALVRVFTSTRV